MNQADLRAHIEQKIRSARLEILPFPHMIINDFLPQEVYDKVLEFNLFTTNDGTPWNSGSGKTGTTSRALNATPYQLRSQINFHKRAPEFEASPEVTEFWDMIQSTFLSDTWFPRTIFAKFPEYFYLRFGENAERDDFWTICRKALFVQRHKMGYDLGPHTDIPTRIFTCLFSFPETTGYEQYGTALLRHTTPYTISTGHRHHSFDGFETVKMNEYKPNNFMCFFKTVHAFHAVPPIKEELPNQRYGMQFQFHEPLKGLLQELGASIAPSAQEKIAAKRAEPESVTISA